MAKTEIDNVEATRWVRDCSCLAGIDLVWMSGKALVKVGIYQDWAVLPDQLTLRREFYAEDVSKDDLASVQSTLEELIAAIDQPQLEMEAAALEPDPKFAAVVAAEMKGEELMAENFSLDDVEFIKKPKTKAQLKKEIAEMLAFINEQHFDDFEFEVQPSLKPGTYLVIRRLREIELADASLVEVHELLTDLSAEVK